MEDLFVKAVASISEITGLESEQILHRYFEACAEARFALVHILSEIFTDQEIANGLGLTRTCVNKLKNSRHRLRHYHTRKLAEELRAVIYPLTN